MNGFPIDTVVLVDSSGIDADPVCLPKVSLPKGAVLLTHMPKVPMATYQIDGQKVSVAYRPEPFDPKQLSTFVAAARTWPGAAEAVEGATGYFVIGSDLSPEGHEQTESTSMAVSRMAAAVASSYNGKALFWKPSGALVDPKEFVSNLDDPNLSPSLVSTWVHMSWFRGDPLPGSTAERPPLAVSTTGLARFVGREIELLPTDLPAAQIAELVIFVSRYLIRSGPVLASGHTLGFDERRAVKVDLLDEGLRPGIPVISLTYRQNEITVSD
ncbi:DUF4261 domain-containing protein [Cognatiyoonia sp. IB215446]|uniref:DUF4261 domain-containing protein n=1 Tax=Cognatiyoonia sp. IB215446 TaxID=3097355 RepID=UPI002A13C476|nr:DUF4261 domain-containing protein [Cognatiyoonia sp. IB215446]MDX8348614.1 DUF4261 domain-containing protein [Cognatiyoonia sp. IB215446]